MAVCPDLREVSRPGLLPAPLFGPLLWVCFGPRFPAAAWGLRQVLRLQSPSSWVALCSGKTLLLETKALLPWALSLAWIPVYLVGPSSQLAWHQRPGHLANLQILLAGDGGPGSTDEGLTQAHPACLPWSAQRLGSPPHELSPLLWAPASAGGSEGGGKVCPPLLLPRKQLHFPECVLQNTRSAYYSSKAGWASVQVGLGWDPGTATL